MANPIRNTKDSDFPSAILDTQWITWKRCNESKINSPRIIWCMQWFRGRGIIFWVLNWPWSVHKTPLSTRAPILFHPFIFILSGLAVQWLSKEVAWGLSGTHVLWPQPRYTVSCRTCFPTPPVAVVFRVFWREKNRRKIGGGVALEVPEGSRELSFWNGSRYVGVSQLHSRQSRYTVALSLKTYM